MRTTGERRGNPDRSRAGNNRSSGAPDYQSSGVSGSSNTNPRRGLPDRSYTGSARGVDTRRSTRNDLRQQFGEIELDYLSDVDALTPADTNRLAWNATTLRWEPVAAGSDIAPVTAVDVGIDDVAGNFTGTDVEAALAELVDPVDVVFTATDSYSYQHNGGDYPAVTVLDARLDEIVVCVRHPDVNTVDLFFSGQTLTDATLVLN